VALAGVLCMFGLDQWGQATTTFLAQHQSLTNFIIGGALVLALITQIAKHGLSVLAGYPLVGWLTIALFLYAFTSAQWAPRSDLSLEVWNLRWPYVVTFIILSPLLTAHARDLESANVGLLLIGGLLTALLLFFVKWESRTIVMGNGFGNPLAVSSMAGMIVLVAILADPWPASRLWSSIKWMLVAMCLVLVVKSGSRGQLLGIVVIAAACWPISRRIENARQFLGWTCLLLFLAGITSWSLQEYWGERETYFAGGNRWSGQAMEEAMSDRFTSAFRLLRFWFDSPVTVFFGLGNSASYDPRILGIYPHFVPLEILAEEGIVGATLFSLILFVTTKTAIHYHAIPYLTPAERATFSALIGMFAFTLLLALKQGSLLGNLEPFMFAIIIGRLKYFQKVEDPQRQRKGDRLAQSVRLDGRYPILN
jgi:hypothetical protein